MIRLEVPDPDHELTGVRLASDLPLTDDERAFAHHDGAWVLELHDRRLTRLEYLLEVDGATAPDPTNPDTAPGAFGEKSVWCAEDYVPPHWLEDGREAVEGGFDDLPVRSKAVRTTVHTRVWSPAGAEADEPLPLLVALDGPEFDELARLTHWAAVGIADFELPRMRVALLPPGARDEWYSASTAFARALCQEVLPSITAAFATAHRPVAMGASLGGLALLHAHRAHPGTFDGLFLQSGSYFVPEHDEHEGGFPRFGRITRFTRALHKAGPSDDDTPVVLTCGAEEENIHNNRLVADLLPAATLVELGDLHNYTAWRDAFDPHLTDLLARVWVPGA